MRLEITHQDGDTEILEFTQSPVLVGRGSKCDLRVTGEGISRHHCQLEEKNGQFFVTDLGSSNGTFVNEEKIAAHTPTEFNTFFPVIVGAGTIVSLLGEEDGRAATKPKTTLDRSRKAANQTSQTGTSLLASNPNEYKPTGNGSMSSMMSQDATGDFSLDSDRKGRKKKKQSKDMDPKQAAVALLLVGAGLFYYMTMEDEPTFTPPPPRVVKKVPAPTQKVEEPKLDLSTIPPNTVLNYSKCLNENEKSYCSDFAFQDYYEGFVIKGEILFVAIQVENQNKDFEFKQQLSSDEQIELERLRTIENKARQRNANFEGFDASDLTLSKATILSIIYNQAFAGKLLNDRSISTVYIVGFIREKGKPVIQNSIVIDKKKFATLGNERYLSAFKMLLIGKHNQMFTKDVVPLIEENK